MTRVLIFGATGMLGNALLRYFAAAEDVIVQGTARSMRAAAGLSATLRDRLVFGVDANDSDSLLRAVAVTKPDVIINAMGLVKQLAEVNDPLLAVPMNSLLPHRLQLLAAAAGARLIHISTDCVFSGHSGSYRESDRPDADDLYGRSKLLGEVTASTNAVTLRTSIIGRELAGTQGLVDWFLAATGSVKGYARAIFSGVPTVELARIIGHHVIPNPGLHGLYHVAATPISKLDLLQLIADRFDHHIDIVPDDHLVIDRSLDGSRFSAASGYTAPSWLELIAAMQVFG